MNSGIYQIVIGKHGYIGSTCNLKRREREHKISLKNNRHFNIKMQRAYNKYKEFNFNIIDLCAIDKLEIQENFFINSKDTLSNLNINPVSRGQGLSGEKHWNCKITEEQARKIIDLLNDGFNQAEISRHLSINKTIINKIKTKKCWNKLSHLLLEVNKKQLEFINLCNIGYSLTYSRKKIGIGILQANKIYNKYIKRDIKKINVNKKDFSIIKSDIIYRYNIGNSIRKISRDYNISYNSTRNIIKTNIENHAVCC